MYRSAYYEMTEDPMHSVVVLRRTAEPYASAADVRAEVEALVMRFERRYRRWGAVVDMREAPPRNDLDFEAAMRHLRFRMGQAFASVVVLVATASGEMQVTRLHREGRFEYRVTRNLEDAVRLASAAVRPERALDN